MIEVTSFTLTNNVQPKPLAPGLIERGRRTVEGTITVHFTAPGVVAAFRRGHAEAVNRALRMVRPHMTKRGWFRVRGKAKAHLRAKYRQPRPAPEPELPEGVWEQGGRLMYTCLSCRQPTPMECELEEYDPAVAYCGGSPRCLP